VASRADRIADQDVSSAGIRITTVLLRECREMPHPMMQERESSRGDERTGAPGLAILPAFESANVDFSTGRHFSDKPTEIPQSAADKVLHIAAAWGFDFFAASRALIWAESVLWFFRRRPASLSAQGATIGKRHSRPRAGRLIGDVRRPGQIFPSII